MESRAAWHNFERRQSNVMFLGTLVTCNNETDYYVTTELNTNNPLQRKFKVMIYNSTNKTNSSLSSQIIEHKTDHDIWHWKSRSWLDESTKCGRVNPVDGNQTLPFLLLGSQTTIQNVRYKQTIKN